LSYLPIFFEGVCDSALAAAVFDSLLVRPSLSVLDAAVAAVLPVCFDDVLACERALAAAVFDVFPVEPEAKVFDAFSDGSTAAEMLPF
jgi:hypothetical protein